MKVLQRDQGDELWDKFWDETRREWFKCEVLQDYGGEDDGPSLRKWLAGDKQASMELMKIDAEPDFTAKCLEMRSRGVKLRRVHILERPLSAYMEWEIEFYKRFSVPIRGEEVYLIEKEELGSLKLPAGDFMIFDQKRAVVNTHNAQGRVTASHFYDETDDIGWLLDLRADIMAAGKPLLPSSK